MTGIIFDIKRFAVHDGPGIRTTVFFKGCPLKCSWCHNPESIDPTPTHVSKTVKLNGRSYTKDETVGYEISDYKLLAELEKERVFMEESGGGVTFSGGEPLLQYNFLVRMLELCKEKGMHTAVDTTLFTTWDKVENLASLASIFLVDLKLVETSVHQQYTGVPNEAILDNIRKLSALNASIYIRIPMVPNVSMSATNVEQSTTFLKTLPNKVKEVALLPFHNTANEKYKRVGRENQFGHLKSLKKEDLFDFKEQLENAGFLVKIGG